MKGIRKDILLIYAALLAIGIPYAVFVAVTGTGIPCFYLTLSGYKCAGCGISHMLMSMLRLDFVSAFFYNPLMFVLFFFWNTVAVLLLIGRPAFVGKPKFLYASLFSTLAAMVLFGILRNLL